MDCESKVSDADRQLIHSEFWTLSESGKRHYYARTTERRQKHRTRTDRQKRTDKERSRTYSYRYFFYIDSRKVHVCKSFYLSTLDISNKRLATYYATRNHSSGTPSESIQGKYTKKRNSDDLRDAVRAHINSFNRVESHYCRAKTNRQYLDPGLSLSRMYDMFCEGRMNDNSNNPDYVEPVKKHIYESIFNTEYNLGFHVPKGDRCDTCEAFVHNIKPTVEQINAYEQHKLSKEKTKCERDSDRKIMTTNQAVVCFDMQNVISLPRANISSFFLQA
jgi:hypothetical protein